MVIITENDDILNKKGWRCLRERTPHHVTEPETEADVTTFALLSGCECEDKYKRHILTVNAKNNIVGFIRANLF